MGFSYPFSLGIFFLLKFASSAAGTSHSASGNGLKGFLFNSCYMLVDKMPGRSNVERQDNRSIVGDLEPAHLLRGCISMCINASFLISI